MPALKRFPFWQANVLMLALATPLALLLAGCGGDSASTDGFNAREAAVQFKSGLDSFPDKRIKDTILFASNDSVRVLLANYKIPKSQLIEDIGFDQIEAQLLVIKSDQELHRQTIGTEWGRTALNRTDMNFSPLVDIKFEELAENKLAFRMMLVEYDQNKMHYVDYYVASDGKANYEMEVN